MKATGKDESFRGRTVVNEVLMRTEVQGCVCSHVCVCVCLPVSPCLLWPLFRGLAPFSILSFAWAKVSSNLKAFVEKPCEGHQHFAALTALSSSFLQCQFNPCFPGVKCVNTAPGYRCDACPLGYTGQPVEGVGVLFAQNNKQVKNWRKYGEYEDVWHKNIQRNACR